MGFSFNLQIGTGQGRLEEAARRGPAPPTLLVDVEIRDTFVAARIEIADAGNAGLDRGFDEGIQDVPAGARGLDAPFAAHAMMLAGSEVVIEVLAEDRLHIVPTPARKTHLAPVVVILALASHVDHSVDRRAAAQDLAPRIVQDPAVQACLSFGLEHPIGAGIADGEEIADRDVKPDPVVLAASFENADRVSRILGQAVCQNAAGGTCPDNYVIKCIAA